jgi:signal transduction histidine kinase
LVTNAIKHADQRVIHISLAIRSDGLVTLKVRDFGIGLSPGVVAGRNYDPAAA